MIEIRRILCPIDFSEFSRRALDHAVAIARRYGSTITVLNVCPLVPATAYAPGMPMMPILAPTPGDLDALLESMKQFVTSEVSTSVAIRFEIGEGETAAEILDRAQVIPCDLIVMGTHGRSGFDRLVLGSVTEKVIRKATCPVLTVPRPMEDAVPSVLFARILCAIDFSDASLRALEYALSLAQQHASHVTVMHTVELTPAPAAADVESAALDAYVAAARDARAQQLERIIPDNVRSSCTVDHTLAIGKAHREILRIASERNSDLIVLGAHGFGVTRLVFGSTANQIVRQARCPVLTIR